VGLADARNEQMHVSLLTNEWIVPDPRTGYTFGPASSPPQMDWA
jgi:hypothetical protein